MTVLKIIVIIIFIEYIYIFKDIIHQLTGKDTNIQYTFQSILFYCETHLHKVTQ